MNEKQLQPVAPGTPAARLMAMANEARQQYLAEIEAGGEPVYPAWIDDVVTLCRPAPPCPTCNDQGAVGNILNAQPCPDCTPAPSAPGDAQDERQAFEAWLARRGVWPALCFEEVFIAGWNARPAGAPAAGDALAALRELVRLQNLKDSKNHQPNPQRSDEWAEHRRLWPAAMEKARAALSAQVPQQGEA